MLLVPKYNNNALVSVCMKSNEIYLYIMLNVSTFCDLADIIPWRQGWLSDSEKIHLTLLGHINIAENILSVAS